ncbi:MAG: hypothetical protein PGN21_14405 [Sphingomonas paucimobilis]
MGTNTEFSLHGGRATGLSDNSVDQSGRRFNPKLAIEKPAMIVDNAVGIAERGYNRNVRFARTSGRVME